MDASDVNRLLERSQSAHAAYRRAANPDPPGKPNYIEAEQQVALAQDYLMQAHAADPEHRSSGWASLRAPYEKLVGFYSRYALIP